MNLQLARKEGSVKKVAKHGVRTKEQNKAPGLPRKLEQQVKEDLCSKCGESAS